MLESVFHGKFCLNGLACVPLWQRLYLRPLRDASGSASRSLLSGWLLRHIENAIPRLLHACLILEEQSFWWRLVLVGYA